MQYFSLAIRAGPVDTDHIQVKDKAVRSAEYPELLRVAGYFYSDYKHLKPVYDFRTPSRYVKNYKSNRERYGPVNF